MHEEPYNFVKRAIVAAVVKPYGAKVVEFGAFDMNGSVRPLFPGVHEYVGIDWRPGPGVDVVALAHDYRDSEVDVVVCTQMLEHDPYAERTVANGVHLLRAGGVLILTWAGPHYDVHEVHTAPPDDNGNSGHYRNLSLDEVEAYIRKAADDFGLNVEELHRDSDRGGLDVYIWARISPPA